jgi:hypothetical protein
MRDPGSAETTNYWHCLGSSWIIKTDQTAEQLFDRIRPHIDNDDRLIVIRLVSSAKSTRSFSKECQDWLHKNLINVLSAASAS